MSAWCSRCQKPTAGNPLADPNVRQLIVTDPDGACATTPALSRARALVVGAAMGLLSASEVEEKSKLCLGCVTEKQHPG